MTTPPAPVPATHHEDRPLPYRMLALVAVITLGIFGLGIVWSTHILNATVAEQQPDPAVEKAVQARIQEKVNQPEIGIVNQRMFQLDTRAGERRELQLKRLNSFGAVDPKNQVAHIPIERAMQLYLAEQNK